MCVQENQVCTLNPDCVIAQAVKSHLRAPASGSCCQEIRNLQKYQPSCGDLHHPSLDLGGFSFVLNKVLLCTFE